MFKSIDYLRDGNDTQRSAYMAIRRLNILHDLKEYSPILCGTVPIDINIKDSDLDIIMEVHDFSTFKEKVAMLYHTYHGFRLKEVSINNTNSVVSNFRFAEFDFQLFAQPIKVDDQNAYRHMIIEHYLMLNHPQLKKQVIQLKQLGMKTEPAFAKVLGLVGDPYDELLKIGFELGIM